MEILEKGFNGLPTRMLRKQGELETYIEITYDSSDRVIQREETTLFEDRVVDQYIQIRAYHDNGELALIKDNEGNESRFDRRGIPTFNREVKKSWTVTNN